MLKIHIDSREHLLKEINNNLNKLIIYMFTAKWCGPCQMIKKKLETMENHNVVIFYIDVDKVDDVTTHFEVKSLPTFMIMKVYENELIKVDEFVGANILRLEESIEQNL